MQGRCCKLIGVSEKMFNDIRTVKFAKQTVGSFPCGTETRTAVTSMATPPAQSSAPCKFDSSYIVGN